MPELPVFEEIKVVLKSNKGPSPVIDLCPVEKRQYNRIYDRKYQDYTDNDESRQNEIKIGKNSLAGVPSN